MLRRAIRRHLKGEEPIATTIGRMSLLHTVRERALRKP
jgi:hypothetical protein